MQADNFQRAGSSDFEDQNRSAVIKGLSYYWLPESKARIEDYFGIKGDNSILRANMDYNDRFIAQANGLPSQVLGLLG